MLLGQVVAISFAQSLFIAKLSSLNRQIDSTRPSINLKDSKAESKLPIPSSLNNDIETPSIVLCTCVYLSLFTVALTPLSVHTSYFLPNLLIMHALLIIPLLPTFSSSTSKGPISYSTLYLSIAFLSLLTLIPTYSKLFPLNSLLSTSPLTTLQQLKTQAIYTLFEHPAQSSIGFDVVFTSLSFLIWILLEFRNLSFKNILLGGLVVGMTPIVGIGVSGSLYLGLREDENKVRKVD